MYTKLNYAIEEYIQTQSTDYGLMIAGDWGCGKTFYLNNELIYLLKQKPYNLKPIVVSLNGLSNINHILNNILIETYLEKDNKVTKQIKKLDLNALTKTSKNLPKIGSIINVLSESTLLYKNYDFENIILIIDDLERTTLNISEVLGYITENFINKNVKTIIFGNEKEIINKKNKVKYNKIKEKTFRKVIKFTVDDSELINKFIESKYINKLQLYTILKNNEKLITELYSNLDEKNLRTIDFAISILEKSIDILNKLKASDEVISKIFSIILALSIEHKKGGLSLSNPEMIEDLKSINNFYPLTRTIKLNNDKKEEKQENATYKDVFSIKYLETYHIEYNPIVSLIDYITTGFLDELKLTEELINFYNLDQTILEKKIIQINEFKYYKQKELDKNIEYIFNNLINVELLDSLEIYSRLIFLKEEVYKNKWKYHDIHERFKIYLSQKNTINIKDEYLFHVIQPLKNHNLSKHFYESKECRNYKKMLDEKYTNLIFEKQKEKYINLFDSIIYMKYKISHYLKIIDTYDNANFFKHFVEFGLIDKLNKINYMIIAIFKSQLSYNILRVSNAGDFYYSEKAPLIEVKEKLESLKIEDLILNYQITDLITELNKAIEHLEKTKK